MADRLTRIAIVSSDRCKPKKCRQECKKSCPVVKTGILCFFFFLILLEFLDKTYSVGIENPIVMDCRF